MYLWQEGDRVGYGSYRHEPLLLDPGLIDDSVSAPADLPFDESIVEPGVIEAERLIPALRGRGLSDRVLGLFSFTPDAQSLVGESVDVRGIWVAEAVWVTHAAGVGRAVAQLMTAGACELDMRELDLNRFPAHVPEKTFIHVRGRQQYREIYDVIHPRQQITAPRGLRRAPWYDRQRELGANCFESNGWERPQWFEANRDLPAPPQGTERQGWNAQEWSPVIGREHRAVRERAGLFDLSTFTKIEVTGAGALTALHRLSATDLDRPIGRVTYALFLNERGGIESDLTVTRLAEDRFLLLCGSGSGPRDLALARACCRDAADAHVADVTSAWCGLGLWGPAADAILADLTGADPRGLRMPPYAAVHLFVAGLPCLALRMSYVGEDGWELHVPTEYGAALWDALWDAGQPLGLIAAGGGAMDSLRLERGFRALGTELRGEFTPRQAGLGFAVSRTRRDFVGFAGLLRDGSDHRLVALVLDDPRVILVGKEPILAESDVVGWVTSANFGYTIECNIAYGYVPGGLATPGTRLTVEYFGVRYAATVTAEPLWKRPRATENRS